MIKVTRELLRREFCRAEGGDPSYWKIEESPLSEFGVGTVYRLTCGSRREYNIVESEDILRELALAIVIQDLENEPGIFNREFIERHINIDRLRSDLESDLNESNLNYAREISDRRFRQEAEQWSLDIKDKDGNERDITPADYEALAEAITESQMKDPMNYLDEICGNDAAGKAIEIAGINVKAAAEDAVDTDGPEHFVCRYDGNSHTTSPSGFCYWRE